MTDLRERLAAVVKAATSFAAKPDTYATPAQIDAAAEEHTNDALTAVATWLRDTGMAYEGTHDVAIGLTLLNMADSLDPAYEPTTWDS